MNTTTELTSAGTAAVSHPQTPPAGTGPGVLERLAEPFPVDWLHFKPEVVKGNQALAVAYLNARDVQDRLDAVVGPASWKTEYTQVGPSSVECRLSIRIGGEWVGKADVGSFSEQKDAGDKMKAAYSDALKRAAVQWGVGRYLYQLAPIWCPYDGASKRFTQLPQLPDWAKPKAITHDAGRATSGSTPALPEKPKSKMPATGAELVARLKEFEAAAVAKKLCRPGDLIGRVSKWCGKAGHATDLTKLDARGIEYAVGVVKEWNADQQDRQQNQGEQPPVSPPPAKPPETKGNPNAAAVGVRQGILNVLRERGKYIEKEFKEPLDKWLSRNVDDKLTFAELEKNPEAWGVDAISQIAEELKQYIDGGVPY